MTTAIDSHQHFSGHCLKGEMQVFTPQVISTRRWVMFPPFWSVQHHHQRDVSPRRLSRMKQHAKKPRPFFCRDVPVERLLERRETCRIVRGLLKKAASAVPCLRRSGFAQAGHQFFVLTYWKYAPRVKQGLSPSGYAKPFAAFPSAWLRT